MTHDPQQSVVPLESSRIPAHVAVIMDGNGRWARRQGLPRIEGHRAGARTVRMVVEQARRRGIKFLTLFAFSTENWQRPPDEVSLLMKLFIQYLEGELEELLKNGIRLRAMGDLRRLPGPVRELLERNIARTQHLQGLNLVLAVSYGGRDEIVRATAKLAEAARSGKLNPQQLTEENFREFLDAPDIPDPDLLIRTSDEMRISNFLLWQLAYSEIVVTPKLWPEFGEEEFSRCLEEYARRTRRFGKTDDQLRSHRESRRGSA